MHTHVRDGLSRVRSLFLFFFFAHRCPLHLICWMGVLSSLCRCAAAPLCFQKALDVVSKMLSYDPLKRVKPLEVCSHEFVDEVRIAVVPDQCLIVVST